VLTDGVIDDMTGVTIDEMTGDSIDGLRNQSIDSTSVLIAFIQCVERILYTESSVVHRQCVLEPTVAQRTGSAVETIFCLRIEIKLLAELTRQLR